MPRIVPSANRNQAAPARGPHRNVLRQAPASPGVAAPARKSAAAAGAKPLAPPGWSKSAPIELKSGAKVDDAIYAVLTASRDHWLANVAAAIDGRDPEGLHQVRVGLRRLRSALTAFKKFLPAEQRSALIEEAKWLLTQLGPARDFDVLISDLSAPLADRLSVDAELAQLMRAARLECTRAQTAAAKALRSARAARFAGRLDAWLDGRGWRTGGTTTHDGRMVSAEEFAHRFLNRRLRNIRADYGNVDALTTEERHDLRIAVKKTRYGIEFFQALLPNKRAARLNGVLKALQDNLGHLNDIDVADRTVTALVNSAENAVARRQIAAGGSVVRRWHNAAAAKAEPETIKLWRKLKKAPLF